MKILSLSILSYLLLPNLGITSEPLKVPGEPQGIELDISFSGCEEKGKWLLTKDRIKSTCELALLNAGLQSSSDEPFEKGHLEVNLFTQGFAWAVNIRYNRPFYDVHQREFLDKYAVVWYRNGLGYHTDFSNRGILNFIKLFTEEFAVDYIKSNKRKSEDPF
jgi:hypothetical protein